MSEQDVGVGQDVTSSPEDDVNTEECKINLLGILPVVVLITILVVRLIFVLYKYSGQKTRSPQQRRGYMGQRSRPSLTPTEPTIYVSPANLPPPPKYEAMAPPSYDEVVGIHYPGYRSPVQPITQPITAAMAQNASVENNSNGNNVNNETTVTPPPTVITVTTDSRTSVTVASS